LVHNHRRHPVEIGGISISLSLSDLPVGKVSVGIGRGVRRVVSEDGERERERGCLGPQLCLQELPTLHSEAMQQIQGDRERERERERGEGEGGGREGARC